MLYFRIMSLLVSWSIAYDYIMNFPDVFSRYILPDHLDKLSVNFNIDRLHRQVWWAGHNIAYNLALLWEKALLMGAVWSDFSAPSFHTDHIDYRYTRVSKSFWTPSAHIITDEANNQITAFYPWASYEATQQFVRDVQEHISLAIVSPNNPVAMLQHLLECKELGIRVIFDPGQPLSAFNRIQLRQALEACTYLIVNEYELWLLCRLAELSEDDLLDYVDAYVVTLGEHGSRYVDRASSFVVDAVATDVVVDPTGAGDAFRAGVLRWLYYDKDWRFAMSLGSVMAHYCIQHHGTQEHKMETSAVADLLFRHYGFSMSVE